MTDSLVISSRFCGPPGSGNGGYVCGRVAAYLDGPRCAAHLRWTHPWPSNETAKAQSASTTAAR